ncbi:MAG TPA: hypothetical protein VGB77_17800 [Abditibacteriaceae bacterium]|jgi:hypothetical protein
MWIKARNGNIYRREAFFMFDIDSSNDASIEHNYLRARLTPAPAGSGGIGLKTLDPGAVILGDYKTVAQARQALARLFPERHELIDLSGDE